MKRLLATAAVALGLTGLMPAGPAQADQPFIGEISWFAGNFAPRDWAFCDGQLLPISSNTALFSIIGTTFGGDGRTTMALPNLQGRSPMGPGRGPGLTPRRLGERLGATTTTMTVPNLPGHTHSADMRADTNAADFNGPNGLPIGSATIYSTSGGPNTALNANAVSVGTTGGGQAANNVQPVTTLNCIIALQGLYPSRN